ncbi:MAG TPA: gamma-glutamyl-gamma-aminobutyrate hydrolase family protein [Bauldia sp.]|nr:gamma-glutamyl-gamma-aminobutyrate hydrolase family protein [Bauldia sp.]
MLHHAPIPLVAVAADVKDIDGYRWHAAADQYLRALINGAGVLPLILPSLKEIDFDALLERVDGVLFPGSRTNVHPNAYGEAEDERAKPFDPARDAVTLPLMRASLQKGVPLFAVCRGMQELNVASGGSLVSEVQELPGRADHRAPVSDDPNVRFAIRQDVDVKPGGLLAGIMGPGMHRVNSLHRQAVGRLGDNLTVEAVAPDGTVEAVSVKNAAAFALGVQWHPEYWVTTDTPSRALFAAFGDAVRRRMALRTGLSSAAE